MLMMLIHDATIANCRAITKSQANATTIGANRRAQHRQLCVWIRIGISGGTHLFIERFFEQFILTQKSLKMLVGDGPQLATQPQFARAKHQ